ncbi:MAG: FISUMP domain-containing protein [Sphingomicrobium sp.]
MLLTLLASITASRAEPAFIDPRDGQHYRVVAIGGQRWMAENLRFAEPGSVCFDDKAENCAELGRLYDYDTAARSYPPDWRLPSDPDWIRLERSLGASAEEAAKERHRALGIGAKLKAGGDTGFDALLAGYLDPHEKAFQHKGRTSAFWASTLDRADDVSALAWHRDVDVRRTGIYRSKVNVTYKLPVRCVTG